jgi:hypothetical protein
LKRIRKTEIDEWKNPLVEEKGDETDSQMDLAGFGGC